MPRYKFGMKEPIEVSSESARVGAYAYFGSPDW